MKANEAPEKIFVPNNPAAIFAAYSNKTAVDDIEYTRTDALPCWKKSTLPNNNVTGINSEYLCYKGYTINYKELFEKLPKDD